MPFSFNTFNKEKIVSFFVEKPKAYQFEIFEDCEINREQPFYTFVKGRFEESKEYEPRCFSIKDDAEEEVYINFCPTDDKAIPVYPFLWKFFQLRRKQYPHIKFVLVVIPPKKYKCNIDPSMFLSLRILSKKNPQQLTDNFVIENVLGKFLQPQLGGVSEALIVLPEPDNIDNELIKNELEKYLENKAESKVIVREDEQNIVEIKKDVLLDIVEEVYSEVIVPKVWKIRNIVSLMFAGALIAGGFYGWQKYVEWKKLQEMKNRKVWTPSETFKINHFGYILDSEKQKWKKIANLFPASVVQPRIISADKRKISVIEESPAPLKGFALRGNKYLKVENIPFPPYPSWKKLKSKPDKPLPSLKKAYERFKSLVGPSFEIKTYPTTVRVNGLNLKNCIEIDINRHYPTLETKKFFNALSKTDFILKKVSASKTESGFNFEVKGYLCGK